MFRFLSLVAIAIFLTYGVTPSVGFAEDSHDRNCHEVKDKYDHVKEVCDEHHDDSKQDEHDGENHDEHKGDHHNEKEHH